MRNNYHNAQQSEESVTKISRSKSRNQITYATKLKQKQSGWNERFHLQHIPQYNYMNQPHSHYLKNKLRIPNNRKNQLSKAKRMHQPSLEKNKVHNKPNPRRNQQRLKQAINKAFSDLKALWYEKAIPECHMQLMTKIFNRENNPMKILQDIKQEFSDISKQISLVQKIITSIETRQNCLEQIKQLQNQLGQERDLTKITKGFQQKISHLRILTIHCIQCIFQWKQSIQPIIPKSIKVSFTYNNSPYTKKIKEDYETIINSKMNQIYTFDIHKLDAFFLNYTFEGKKISNVSKNLIKRIRLCQLMLSQQDDNLENSESIGTRQPTLFDKKSPPYDRKDKSMPPKGKTPDVNPWKKISVQYGNFLDYFTNLLKKSGLSNSFMNAVQLTKYQEITIFQFVQTAEQIILAIDKNASQRKVIILALKSALDTVQNFLKNVCQYLWEHDLCTQIRTSLLHQQIGQNFSVDVDLEKKFKNVGFRWISINNHNNIRTTIYSIKRPLNTQPHSGSNKIQAYPVMIEQSTLLSLTQKPEKKEPNICLASVLSLFKHLEENKKELYQQICQRDEYSYHLQCLAKIQQVMKKEAIKEGITEGYETKFTYSGLRPFEIPNQQELQKIFKNISLAPHKITQFPAHLSLLNTSFKFRNFTINDGKYIKFFPNKDIQILICQSNYPIYLLQTDEENINFFIIEVEETFCLQSIDSIFNAMGEQSSFIDEFWLPAFAKSRDYIDEVAMINRERISTNYKNHLSSLTRKNKVRTKVIRAPFVFGRVFFNLRYDKQKIAINAGNTFLLHFDSQVGFDLRHIGLKMTFLSLFIDKIYRIKLYFKCIF